MKAIDAYLGHTHRLPNDPVAYAHRDITDAAQTLLELAQHAETVSEALALATVGRELRAALDAVVNAAMDRADSL